METHNRFDQFVALHQQDKPLLLGNIWDVSSATMFEAQGYQAIGTSSSAFARTFGFEDGEHIPFDTLLQTAAKVVEAVGIPFSVDIEGGFDRTVAGIVEHISKLHDAGVVGVNLEDSIAFEKRQIQQVGTFQKILSGVADSLSGSNIKIFLNIRTDGFLLGMSDPLPETLHRIKHYENCGADGIFVPCITRKEDIAAVVHGTRLPVNVMCMPNLPDFATLQALGVRRISMGPFLSNYVNKKTEEAMKMIVQENSFSSLFR